jgi:hypothetical protein
MRIRAGRVIVVAVVGLTLGALLGDAVGLGIRSDNLPFLAGLGAVIGLCIGLAIGFVLDRWHAA